MRNYFIGIVENEKGILLGNFHIGWPFETNFYDAIYKGCLAFKILYRLNYLLWKTTAIQAKK